MSRVRTPRPGWVARLRAERRVTAALMKRWANWSATNISEAGTWRKRTGDELPENNLATLGHMEAGLDLAIQHLANIRREVNARRVEIWRQEVQDAAR